LDLNGFKFYQLANNRSGLHFAQCILPANRFFFNRCAIGSAFYTATKKKDRKNQPDPENDTKSECLPLYNRAEIEN